MPVKEWFIALLLQKQIFHCAICSCRPFYKAIDVGSYGKDSDSRIFENSAFYQRLVNDQLNLPPPKPFPSCTKPIPHVFVGDESFALKPYLMRPFPRKQAKRDDEKQYL